jgi:hypothetical protein
VSLAGGHCWLNGTLSELVTEWGSLDKARESLTQRCKVYISIVIRLSQ